jgi:hypothetical protein
VYIVHTGQTFDVATANELTEEAMAEGAPGYRTVPLTGPRIVGARMPDDRAEREKLMFQVMRGVDLPQVPKYYRPYEETKLEAARQALPLADLRAKRPAAAADIDAAVRKAGRPEAEVRYLPLRARMGSGTVIVDGATGDIVTMLAVDPF